MFLIRSEIHLLYSIFLLYFPVQILRTFSITKKTTGREHSIPGLCYQSDRADALTDYATEASIYIYIFVMSVLPVWIRNESNIRTPPHGCAIPHWNRLGKRNQSMEKIQLRAPRTSAVHENMLRSLNKPP